MKREIYKRYQLRNRLFLVGTGAISNKNRSSCGYTSFNWDMTNLARKIHLDTMLSSLCCSEFLSRIKISTILYIPDRDLVWHVKWSAYLETISPKLFSKMIVIKTHPRDSLEWIRQFISRKFIQQVIFSDIIQYNTKKLFLFLLIWKYIQGKGGNGDHLSNSWNE